MSSILVAKQRAQTRPEHFSRNKLHDSIAAACQSVNLPEGHAQDVAEHVCRDVEHWLHDKTEVTSADIRRVATDTLAIICPEAGYLYKHHQTIV
ncbi:hypothetical protein CR983_00715 [Candidatus Saccharibacteria bacterium]|nr:MAG: hypothetical protein CR983_00715 [Candidatus Saccharibacteria bacterium]